MIDDINIKVISLPRDDLRQREITKKLIDIDYECFGDTNLSDQGTLDYWLKNRVASFVELLLSNDEIVGYLDFLAINQFGVKQLESGDWRDGEINMDFLSDKENHKISLYLVSVAIKKEFRGFGLSKKLWNSARERFINNNYFIKDIYGIIWTTSGYGLLKDFNPKIIGHDFVKRPIIRIKSLDGKIPKCKIKNAAN